MPAAPVTYRSYAKINLYLDVLDRRDDGFHNIETVFQSVTLADTLRFTPRPEGIELACAPPLSVPARENLAYRAARRLQRQTGCGKGVLIDIEKRIPVAAGLAGGSGNAAAALLALNDLWELGLSRADLQEIGLELGADIPFCMVGGTMAGTGRGEELEPLAPVRELWIVMAHPPLALRTGEVYNHPALEHGPPRPGEGKTKGFRDALAALEAGDFARVVFNRMESAAFSMEPALARIKTRLLESGCIAAAMSGSGPTLFGVCDSRARAEAAAAAVTECPCSVVATTAAGIERIE